MKIDVNVNDYVVPRASGHTFPGRYYMKMVQFILICVSRMHGFD